jgi:hypothetical protein
MWWGWGLLRDSNIAVAGAKAQSVGGLLRHD